VRALVFRPLRDAASFGVIVRGVVGRWVSGREVSGRDVGCLGDSSRVAAGGVVGLCLDACSFQELVGPESQRNSCGWCPEEPRCAIFPLSPSNTGGT
jgi:hypothetical protein